MKVSFASILGSHVHKSVLKSNLSLSAFSKYGFQVRLTLFQQSLRGNVEGWNRESALSMVKSNSKCVVGSEENYIMVKPSSSSGSMVFK